MNTLTLPRTDLTVSQLCFGCWGITSDFHWGDRDEDQSIATLEAAFTAGVNFFDTAAAYGDGESERLLGKVFAGRRDQLVIASKVRADMMRPEEIVTGCEDSLRRLGTDYLDLYQTHWSSFEVPFEASWEAMLKLQKEGKIRYPAACNLGVNDLQAALSMGPLVSNQLPYNLLWRAIEHEILPSCREHNVGVLAYSPLMHGLLADKYGTAADVPDGRARSRHFSTTRTLARHGEPGCEQETFAALAVIRHVSQTVDRPMAELALAWVAAQPGINCPIVGASSPQQLRLNLAALDDALAAEVVAQLSEATAELRDRLGANPDMWDGGDQARFR